jgi:hypothetical protein
MLSQLNSPPLRQHNNWQTVRLFLFNPLVQSILHVVTRVVMLMIITVNIETNVEVILIITVQVVTILLLLPPPSLQPQPLCHLLHRPLQ